MKDPCKESKCISYPLCFNRHHIEDCPMFDDYITYYISTFLLPKENYLTSNRLSPEVLKLLWTHIETIFPHIQSLAYRLTMKPKKPKDDLYYWSMNILSQKQLISQLSTLK